MELGVGIVYRPELEPLLLEPDTPVQVVEVGEVPTAVAMQRLHALPQPKLARGIGLPVGSAEPPEAGRLSTWRQTVAHLGAVWASGRLGFDRARTPEGLLANGPALPLRQTIEGVVAAAAWIRKQTQGLAGPFAIEPGVNLLHARRDEMTDGAFAAAVATVADCGILLDLRALQVNERSGRQRMEDFLMEIPLERVIELHLDGGAGGVASRSDIRSSGFTDSLPEVARRVVPALPNLGAIVCDAKPSHLVTKLGLQALRGRLEGLHDLWALRRPNPEAFRVAAADSVIVRRLRSGTGIPPAEWERTLAALVDGCPAQGRLAEELSADPGLDALRRQAAEARAGSNANPTSSSASSAHRSAKARESLAMVAGGGRPPRLF
jgi:uncharacterized protein